MATEKRQRTDGTWTYTTPEFDAKWYWPVGTSVRLNGVTRPACYRGQEGSVTKKNPTTVTLHLTSGETVRRVPLEFLERI